jgi:3-oxoacyl-[acyl-carrier protein] reductase
MKEKGNVLITGASGGIGKVLSERMLREGYTVMMQYHLNREALNDLTKQYPGKAFVVECDLESEEAIRHMAENVQVVMGDVDILVNNAGVASSALSWKMDLQEWERVMRINLTAPMLVSRAFVPAMRRKGWGRVVFFSSIVAQEGIAGTGAYAASKSGLFGLCRAMAKELAAAGITVNTIAPGYMDAGMIRVIPDDMREALIRDTPTGTLGDPAALAECVLYLASVNSGFITGQVIPVNGGLSM